MADRRVLSELADAPVGQIEAKLKQLQADKARLEREELQLTELLRARAQQTAGRPERDEPDTQAPAVPAAKRENIAANVLTVVRRAGGQSVAPADIQAQLARNGLQADLANIRRALRRWVQRGALGTDDGRYFDLRPMSNPNFDYTDILPPRTR